MRNEFNCPVLKWSPHFWVEMKKKMKSKYKKNDNCIGLNLNVSKSQILWKTTECPTLSFLLLNRVGIFPEYEIKRLRFMFIYIRDEIRNL